MRPIEEAYWINRIALICRDARSWSKVELARALEKTAKEVRKEIRDEAKQN